MSAQGQQEAPSDKAARAAREAEAWREAQGVLKQLYLPQQETLDMPLWLDNLLGVLLILSWLFEFLLVLGLAVAWFLLAVS